MRPKVEILHSTVPLFLHLPRLRPIFFLNKYKKIFFQKHLVIQKKWLFFFWKRRRDTLDSTVPSMLHLPRIDKKIQENPFSETPWYSKKKYIKKKKKTLHSTVPRHEHAHTSVFRGWDTNTHTQYGVIDLVFENIDEVLYPLRSSLC